MKGKTNCKLQRLTLNSFYFPFNFNLTDFNINIFMNTFIISSTIACIDSNMVKNAQYGNYTDPLRCYDIDSYRYKTIIETTIVVLNDHALFFVKYNDQKNDLHEPCVEVNMISCSMMVLGGSDIQSPCNILGWLLGFITKFFFF